MKQATFDVGGSGIKYIIFEKEIIIKQGHINYSFSKERISLEDVLNEILKVVKSLESEVQIGISMPGIIDSKNIRVLTESGIKDVNIDIVEFFSKNSFIKKIIIENDGNSAALGEWYYRANPKIKNFVNITIGSAIGCGIILNNQLYKGSELKAGEISRMFSNNCKAGDTHGLALDTGIGLLGLKYSKITQNEKILTGKQIFDLYNKNDLLINELVQEWISSIAKTILNLDYILDFDLITVGGGVSENKLFFELLKNEISKIKDIKVQNFMILNETILNRVEISKTKNYAGCYGVYYLLNKQK
ncbi:hypothetical protein MENTO_v1c06680 [Mesoplasma entomophilum]|uniref:ROK family protein n=1 Tax=Mesoplasma entomophilum TaxID=2149 RepID=A0A3S5Y0L4_9MOLU|nr:ROK family protein [Mesoplasma entomophilum]ATQ35799.1 hypothetical protein CS528_03495 [Mesoplasma entomophilum]ATZ19769.1 hypothetical protein MENTO_v1c06680 [Mesoplasma entomophilum]